jgi:hypothetical protein
VPSDQRAHDRVLLHVVHGVLVALDAPGWGVEAGPVDLVGLLALQL